RFLLRVARGPPRGGSTSTSATLAERGGYTASGVRSATPSLRRACGDRPPDRRLRRRVVDLHLAALVLDPEAAPDRAQIRRHRRLLHLLVQLLEHGHADRL